MASLLRRRGFRGRLLDLAGRVRADDAGGGELAELVPDHVLGHVDADELVPVVDHERVAHELGDDVAAPRPGLERLLAARRVQRLDALPDLLVEVRTLGKTAAHRLPPDL